MNDKQLKSTAITREIKQLKEDLGAIIVAHNYQRPEVQDIADFVGDSLELARKCAEAKAKTIVFCGVNFMAETACILNPGALVLLAHENARCPMADMIDEKVLLEWKNRYPRAAVVCYVNTTAAVKAESDICCTSANGVKVVESLGNSQVLFIPDKNLGAYIAKKTGKKMILFPGFCVTHDSISACDVITAKFKNPEAVVLVHPECREEVINLADAALSTSQILRYAKESDAKSFIIGTEEGILHRLKRENPQKTFILLSSRLVCPNMKKTRLENVVETMREKANRITVEEEIRVKAKRALDRMLVIK